MIICLLCEVNVIEEIKMAAAKKKEYKKKEAPAKKKK